MEVKGTPGNLRNGYIVTTMNGREGQVRSNNYCPNMGYYVR